ncbi:Siderophore iron transporter 1 [Neonectria ditissima]|uniref:Siderophore iron transporter 1 n=1 Tax=Neonectria ditissima TaxID=78410 RepID=A0A0P7BN18_9HYPO|nr:Siderophore iron transporter 1 [Neonectria ditissima]
MKYNPHCSPEQETGQKKGFTNPENVTIKSGDESSAPIDEEMTDEKLPPGVIRMEAINEELSFWERCFVFFGLFLVCYALNLNNLTFGTYQGYATSSWQNHSFLSTINVIRGVISAAVMPLAAKLSDMIGRVESFAAGTVFYVTGIIVQASAQNIEAFAVGTLLFQIGYTCCQLLVEILVADMTSLRSRVFWLFLPAMPNIVNVWASGDLTSAILSRATWRWGIGMWSIIFPTCTIPLVAILVHVGRRASALTTKSEPSQRERRHFMALTLDMADNLDLVGLFLLTTALSLFLIPLTLAGGESKKWSTPGIITTLVLGIILFPLFIIWEHKASNPLMPFSILKDRAVWGAMGITIFTSVSWTVQGDFLYTVLLVGYDFSIKAATRVSGLYAFCETVSGMVVGLIIFKVRRCKPFVVGGVLIWFIAYGIMIHFRGGPGSSSQSGIIAGQILLGGAGAMFPFPNIVVAMAMAKHKDIAVLTSLWLTMNWVGYAVGNCASGAIWTQTLYQTLQQNLGPINNTLADAVYASPLTVVPNYPVGTPERVGIMESYRHIQHLLTIAGICFVIPILFFALCIRNTKLRGQFRA